MDIVNWKAKIHREHKHSTLRPFPTQGQFSFALILIPAPHHGYHLASLLSSHTSSFLFCCPPRNQCPTNPFSKKLPTTQPFQYVIHVYFGLFSLNVYINVICEVEFSQSRVRVPSTPQSSFSASMFSAR